MRSTAYNACMDVLDSDHKPVWATLAVSLPVMKHAEQRRLVSHLFKGAAAAAAQPPPVLGLDTSKVVLGQARTPRKAGAGLLGRWAVLCCAVGCSTRQRVSSRGCRLRSHTPCSAALLVRTCGGCWAAQRQARRCAVLLPSPCQALATGVTAMPVSQHPSVRARQAGQRRLPSRPCRSHLVARAAPDQGG